MHILLMECYSFLTICFPICKQGYPSENPEADNAVQVFRIPESNVHSQVLPSTSEVALLIILQPTQCLLSSVLSFSLPFAHPSVIYPSRLLFLYSVLCCVGLQMNQVWSYFIGLTCIDL